MSLWKKKTHEPAVKPKLVQLTECLEESAEGCDVDFKKLEPEVERWLSEGFKDYENGNYRKAVEHFQMSIIGSDSDKKGWNNIGVVHRTLGNFKEAEKAFKRSLEADKEYDRVWENLGILYADHAMNEKAVESLKKAISLDDEREAALVRLALLYYESNSLDDAIEMYDKALNINPKNVDALNNEALVFHKLSQMREERESIEMLEKAVERLEAAIELDPNRTNLWNNLGIIYGFLGKYKASLSSLDRAIALTPSSGTPYFNKARIFVLLGDDENAMIELKTSIKRDPSLWEGAKHDLSLRKITATEEFLAQDPNKGKAGKSKKFKRKRTGQKRSKRT